MRSSSPFIARAVRAITGMARVTWSALSCAVASRPSMRGSWMSIRIRLGCTSRANVSPVSASMALTTVWPADSSRNFTNFMLAALSSTTRTLAMSGDRLSSRHCPPDFGRKAGTVELRLFHDRCDVTIQLDAVLGRDSLGRDHDDRNMSRCIIFTERHHYVEAIHLRHHEIQDNQVWYLTLRSLDCLLASVRAENGAGQILDTGADQLHCPKVVIGYEDFECLPGRDG